MLKDPRQQFSHTQYPGSTQLSGRGGGSSRTLIEIKGLTSVPGVA